MFCSSRWIFFCRYWAVTHVDYIQTRRNGKRIGTMILFVWMTAVIVSIAPFFGWKDPDYLFRVNEQKKCLVSQDLGYQIFATLATFYVPLTAILILYWRIFQTARKRLHKRPGKSKVTKRMSFRSKVTKSCTMISKLLFKFSRRAFSLNMFGIYCELISMLHIVY